MIVSSILIGAVQDWRAGGEVSAETQTDPLPRVESFKEPYAPLINFTPPCTPFPFSMDGGNPNISRKA